MLPEDYGADLMFSALGGWVGVQRKEVADLVASVQDGRLGKQFVQMDRLVIGMLLIEGPIRYTQDGELIIGTYGGARSKTLNKDAVHAILWRAQQRGIWVDFSKNIADTGEMVSRFERWCRTSAGKRSSLESRPGPTSSWGQATHADFTRHLVMGLPGVGQELADRIVAKLGTPFGWKEGITLETLMSVEGVGKKKAAAMWAALDMGEST